MGGKALSTESARISPDEFKKLSDELLPILSHSFTKIAVIPAYTNKLDFGDMDILVSGHYKVNEEKCKLIMKAIGAAEYSLNGTCASFGKYVDGKLFQIDLVSVESGQFNFAYNYFSFNDLGNLLGRIAHKAGFKLGWQGLMRVIRDPKNDARVVGELVITLDWKEAIEFLGYKYDSNFVPSTLEEMFEFAASSEFCNKSIYILENRNHQARTRDRKRKSYSEFLKWLETSQIPAFDWSNKVEIRKEFLDKAFIKWPEFKKDYDKTMSEFDEVQKSKEVFNGTLVNKITGLSGNDLGVFIESFKNSHGFVKEKAIEFARFVNSKTKEELGTMIWTLHNHHKS